MVGELISDEECEKRLWAEKNSGHKDCFMVELGGG